MSDRPDEPHVNPDPGGDEARMHDAVGRYLDAERAQRGWRWNWWVVSRFGFAGQLRPLRPGATNAEAQAWRRERTRRRRIDWSIMGLIVAVFSVAVVVMVSAGGGDRDPVPGYADPQTLTVQVDPNDDRVMPTSVPDGHGGVVTFPQGTP